MMSMMRMENAVYEALVQKSETAWPNAPTLGMMRNAATMSGNAMR